MFQVSIQLIMIMKYIRKIDFDGGHLVEVIFWVLYSEVGLVIVIALIIY